VRETIEREEKMPHLGKGEREQKMEATRNKK